MHDNNQPEIRMKIKRSSKPSENMRAEADLQVAQSQIKKASGEMTMHQMIGLALLIAAVAVVVKLVL